MDNKFQNEQWKKISIEQIAETEKFFISDFGRLASHDKNGDFTILNPSKIKGYPIVNVKLTNGKRTTRYIHKLVAELFIPKLSQNQSFVIHADFNKDNNHVKNLKWADRSMLFEHQAKNPNYKKGLIRYSKLSETDVIRLKKKLKRGKNPLYKIAKEFGITHTQLNRIRSGENWGHIKID
jgi:hypothetical protein